MRPIEDIVIEYLEGTLSQNERIEFEQTLETSAEARQVLEEFQLLYETIESDKTPSPSSNLDDRFFDMLEASSHKEKPDNVVRLSLRPSWVYGAAAAILLLIGFGLGQWTVPQNTANPEVLAIQKEVEETKQLVLMSLRKESASTRLQAVHVSSKVEEADNELLYALIHTMSFDNSLNVQIKATEALAKYAQNPLVKDSFIKMLGQTNAPELQLLLIDLLVNNKSQEALNEMYNLYEKENLPDFVKDRVRNGIEILSL